MIFAKNYWICYNILLYISVQRAIGGILCKITLCSPLGPKNLPVTLWPADRPLISWLTVWRGRMPLVGLLLVSWRNNFSLDASSLHCWCINSSLVTSPKIICWLLWRVKLPLDTSTLLGTSAFKDSWRGNSSLDVKLLFKIQLLRVILWLVHFSSELVSKESTKFSWNPLQDNQKHLGTSDQVWSSWQPLLKVLHWLRFFFLSLWRNLHITQCKK